MQRLWLVTPLVLLTTLLSACSDGTELKWTEEVRLQDGPVIPVSRRSEFQGAHEIGQVSGETLLRMDFEHPYTKEHVHFESRLRGSTSEMESARVKPVSDPGLMHRPYALMIKGRDLYVVTWIDANIDDFYGCPDPPFLLYRWEQGRWERRPLEEIPYRRFAPNLTVDVARERQKIVASGNRLKADQVVLSEIGYGPVEYDFSGMSRQTFEFPPNCASCTQRGPYGSRTDSQISAPTCLREQRDWKARNHLSN